MLVLKEKKAKETTWTDEQIVAAHDKLTPDDWGAVLGWTMARPTIADVYKKLIGANCTPYPDRKFKSAAIRLHVQHKINLQVNVCPYCLEWEISVYPNIDDDSFWEEHTTYGKRNCAGPVIYSEGEPVKCQS